MAKRLLLILVLFIIADVYFFQAFITVFHAPFLHNIYWYVDLLLLLGVFTVIFLRQKGGDIQRLAGDLVTSFLVVFIPKLLTFPVLLAEDLLRLLRGFPARNIYVSEFVLIAAIIIVCVIAFGLTRGRHLYQVKEEILSFPDLPDAFDGFKITQISDIHSGSLSDVKGVQRGIALANAQHSDLLLFTGDLVNNKALEMDSWISDFRSLNAPFGKFSVLGNHDYGDYTQWESAEQKASNLVRLKEIHREMGFKL